MVGLPGVNVNLGTGSKLAATVIAVPTHSPSFAMADRSCVMGTGSLWSLSITNMTIKVQCDPIDMSMLDGIPGLKYNPKRFPAAFLKLPTCSCNIFRTGVVVFLGIKAWHDVQARVCDFQEQMFGVTVVRSTPQLCNIAASLSPKEGKMALNLSGLSYLLRNCDGIARTHYEPEIHNGLKIEFVGCKGCVILHSTGRGIITGAKQKEELENIAKLLSGHIRNIQPRLKQ